MKALDYYVEKTNRRVTFEYSLISGVNDSVKTANELLNLIKGKLCHVNLIPVNSVRETGFVKSSLDDIVAFRSVLEQNGVTTTVRRELGSDIDASCGQLRRKHEKIK